MNKHYHRKLASRMAEMQITNRKMAEKLNISEVAFCNKKAGRTEFKPSEWKIIIPFLNVPDCEAGEYILE